MSTSDRRPYLTATAITQDFLNSCADNLSCQLELTCDIETPTGTLHVSDRHKYVGETFYEALVKFPVIERTIGEWLAGVLEFSTLTIEVSNVDGRFDHLLPGGANFGSWVGKQITVKLGLRDVASTYRTIFSGKITDVGGFKRNTKSITVIARERFDTLSVSFPTAAFTTAEYPNIENDKEGLAKPLIYGDWTVDVEATGSVRAFVVNGNDPNVYGETTYGDVHVVVSGNTLTALQTNTVYLKRGTDAYPVTASDVFGVSGTLNSFYVKQGPAAATVIEGEKYKFETGDEFIVRCKGEAIDGNDDNALAQARHLLQTFGGATAGEFATSWATRETQVDAIKSRIWIQEPQSVCEYALSLLEQVRMEMYVNADQKLAVASLWFSDMVAAPTYTLKNWDVERGSLQTSVDEKNNFNRVQGAYRFDPVLDENSRLTRLHRNDAAIAQVGKQISKRILYPNLYREADVLPQLTDTLRLASANPEFITCNVTWRSLMRDVGDWVGVNVDFGSMKLSGVPCMIRSLGYDPAGIKIPVRLWSFQQTPFGSWSGQGGGIVGGQYATIVQE